MSRRRMTERHNKNMRHPRTRRPTALILTLGLAALTALCLAACGSSSATSSSSSASAAGGTAAATSANRTKLVACLKAHGVTLPSRPPGTAPRSQRRPEFFYGGGAGRSGAAGSRFADPKFRAAFQACGGRAFRGRGFAGRARFNHAAVTKFVACVKQHGYTLPAPNFSGGPIFPASIERNAKFLTAARACQSLLRPSGPPPNPTAAGA